MTIKQADQEALGGLHGELATVLTKAIRDGVMARDKDGCVILQDDGQPMRDPAPAALLSVARQFLKDNKIEAVPVKGSAIAELAGLPEFDGDNVVPLYGAQR